MRLVKGHNIWRIVGEAYWHKAMRGETVEPDISAVRYERGLSDQLFWIM